MKKLYSVLYWACVFPVGYAISSILFNFAKMDTTTYDWMDTWGANIRCIITLTFIILGFTGAMVFAKLRNRL